MRMRTKKTVPAGFTGKATGRGLYEMWSGAFHRSSLHGITPSGEYLADMGLFWHQLSITSRKAWISLAKNINRRAIR